MRNCFGALLLLLASVQCASAQLPFPLPPKPPFAKDQGPTQVLQKVVQSLNSGDVQQRLDAADQLGSFGSFGAELATNALANVLDDKSEHVRYAALQALGALGRDANGALPQVRQRITKATGDYERVLAAWTATQIASDLGALKDQVPMLVAALASEDMATSNQAAKALSGMGRLGHPALVAALDAADAQSSVLILDVLGRTGARTAIGRIVARLKSDDSAVRAQAAAALGQIGPASKPAIPLLRDLLANDKDAAVRGRAADALGRMGVTSPDMTSALSAAATNDDSELVAREAVESLSQLDASTETLLQLMPKLMSDQRASVVAAAMVALAEQGDKALPALNNALQDEKSRYWALLVLADLGPSAKETVPSLTKLLDTKDPVERSEVLMTLGKIGPSAQAALPQIASQLESKDPGVKYAATYALGKIGGKNENAQAALTANMSSDDPLLKMTSAWAAAKMDGASPITRLRAARELAAGLSSDNSEIQVAASRCLSDLKPGPQQLPQLLPRIVQAFQSEDSQVRQAAIDAVEGILSNSDAGRVLSGAISNQATRPVAVLAATRLGDKAKGSTAALIGALDDTRPAVQKDAALALAAIGPDAASAVSALQGKLTDTNAEVRRAAAYALGHIGPQAKASVASLQTALADGSTRSVAAWSLAQIAARDPAVAKAAIPHLIRDLDAYRPGERRQAAEALGLFGPAAVPAVPALKYATEDPDPAVRAAADRSLQAVIKP